MNNYAKFPHLRNPMKVLNVLFPSKKIKIIRISVGMKFPYGMEKICFERTGMMEGNTCYKPGGAEGTYRESVTDPVAFIERDWRNLLSSKIPGDIEEYNLIIAASK